MCCVSLAGGTVQGLISDFMGKRAPVLAFSLVMAMGALVGYSREYHVFTPICLCYKTAVRALKRVLLVP